MEIASFGQFINWTQDCHARSKLTLFRGQPVKGNLLPRIARQNRKYDSAQLERTMLDQFRLRGVSMLPSVGTTRLELLVVAQHFGLKTRLLDWTSNPLVALYFACNESASADSYVYALASETLVARDAYEKDPFSTLRTRVFQPPMNNPRIIAQHGWFTLHRFSDKSEGFVPLERNLDTKPYLEEVLIRASARADLLHALAGHGVASHTLFPDLGGLSQYLNKIYSVA